MTYLTNPLNEYETYTYNLRLYVCQPSSLSSLDGAISSGSALLLADNAQIAKFNISSCEQVFSIGHGAVREAIGSRFALRVAEPNGVTLLSTIKTLCNQLGILNHTRAGYILAIDFHGRKKDGRPHKFPQTFYYPLIISKFDFKVTEGGAQYNIDMVENSQVGYQYLSNVINDQIVVEAQTVGEFVDRFQERLNKSLDHAWRINPSLAAGIRPDQYEFEFDETTQDWRRWRFEALDQDFEVSGTSFIGRAGENPSLQVIATNGSNITNIMSQVLQLTKEYKNILTMQNGIISQQGMRDAPENQTSRQLDSLPVFFKMLSNVEYGEYDQFRGDYTKTIKYRLKAYTVTDEIIDALAYATSITDTRTQNRRVDNLISSNFLRKRYDYYYTGLNTEVLELDMQFDYAYFYVLPYGDGYFGDPEVQTPQVSKDRESVLARLSDVQVAKRNAASAQRSLDNAIAGGSSSLGFFIRGVEAATIQFNTVLEDTLNVLANEYNYTPDEIQYMMRFNADVISDQEFYGSDNNTKSGTLKMGAVRANLDNASDMVKIELVVRGDPYWMGKPNTLYNTQQNVDGLADFEAGSPSFFLNVNLPTNDEGVDGRRKPQPDMQMCGLYTVRSVINRFENGQFVQYLEAVRDLATNISTVYERLAGDSSALTAIDRARQRQRQIDYAQLLEDARNAIGPS